MPSRDITFCSHEGNRCKKRNTCFRYTAEHGKDELVWFGDNWQLYGKECELYLRSGHDEASGG